MSRLRITVTYGEAERVIDVTEIVDAEHERLLANLDTAYLVRAVSFLEMLRSDPIPQRERDRAWEGQVKVEEMLRELIDALKIHMHALADSAAIHSERYADMRKVLAERMQVISALTAKNEQLEIMAKKLAQAQRAAAFKPTEALAIDVQVAELLRESDERGEALRELRTAVARMAEKDLQFMKRQGQRLEALEEALDRSVTAMKLALDLLPSEVIEPADFIRQTVSLAKWALAKGEKVEGGSDDGTE